METGLRASGMRQVVPFFAVSDMAQSVRFYVDGLGFRMTNQWMKDGKLRWCWLEHGGAALMIQEFPTEGHDSYVPSGKRGEGVSLCFICEDAKAYYDEIAGRGIRATKPRVENRMHAIHLTDPDGYRLTFESPTDEPESEAK